MSKYEKDIKLADACMKSNEKAWSELISIYKPVCRIIASRLGVYNCFDDLFSEFILKLLGTVSGKSGVLRQYNSGVSLKTFLSAVFRHMVIDYLRKKKITTLTEKPIEQYADPGPPGELEYSGFEMELWTALNSLSILEKKIVELYYYHNLTLRDIAAIANFSKSKVGRTLKEIRIKLKKKLTSH